MTPSRRPPLLGRAAACSAVLATAASTQGLPPVSAPFENPITADKAILGKILFWDEQLSSDGTVACGTCHRPAAGGVDPRDATHPGFDGRFGTDDDAVGSWGIRRSRADGSYEPDPAFGFHRQVTRHATPTNIGAAYFQALRWDGLAGETFIDPQTRQATIWVGGALESHAAGPPTVDVEMAYRTRSWDDVAARLTSVTPARLMTRLPADMAAALAGGPSYPDLVQRAYGDRTITAERVIFALATYQRTLVPNQSPWDRYVAGNTGALTPDQRAGLALFEGAARCSLCHPAPLFSDQSFRNLGLRPPGEDIGWQVVTHDPIDRGKFKVPTLRNAGLRPRFMHTGRLRTLAEVVDFYDAGGGPFLDNKDPLLVPLNLSAQQKAQLVDFLANALTDPRVAGETFPFDRPVLHSERAPAPFGSDVRGSGNVAPLALLDAPLHRGNTAFRVGVGFGLGGAPAIVAVGARGPDGQRIGNLPFHLALSPPPLLLPVVLAGSGAGDGHATLRFPVPPDRWLLGAPFYQQWVVADPIAPGGLSTTRGTGGTVF